MCVPPFVHEKEMLLDARVVPLVLSPSRHRDEAVLVGVVAMMELPTALRRFFVFFCFF